MQLTDTKKKRKSKNDKVPLVQESSKPSHPEINFKYLYKCNVCCFKGLNKYAKKYKDDSVFDELQRFLSDVDKFDSLEKMLTNYTSKNGSKVKNDYVVRLKKEFKKSYPNEKGLLESGIIHIHTKSNGKGEFVIFGVNYENIFYVLAFDPKHKFNLH